MQPESLLAPSILSEWDKQQEERHHSRDLENNFAGRFMRLANARGSMAGPGHFAVWQSGKNKTGGFLQVDTVIQGTFNFWTR